MLTKKAEYGLRALGVLAREYGRGPLLASTISAQERIPEEFLRLILLQLKKKGLVRSKKGKGGGYVLAQKPSLISVGDLVRVLEGSLALLPRAHPEDKKACLDCGDDVCCGLHALFRQASDATASILDNATLADIAPPRRVPNIQQRMTSPSINS